CFLRSFPTRRSSDLSLAQIVSGTNYPYNGNDETNIGFNIARAPNPNLKWESTTQTDIGVDFALFNGRLTGSFDYYVKTTRDLLRSEEHTSELQSREN